MIELYMDSSGEVDISSGPKVSGSQPAVFSNVVSSSEDEAKIAELNNTIKLLKTQIKASVAHSAL